MTKEKKETNATAIIKEEIALLKQMNEYPMSAIAILEKVLGRINGTFHSTEPVEFTTKHERLINY